MSIGCRIVVFFVVIGLSGCGKTELSQVDVDLSARAQDAQAACLEANKLDLARVPAEAIGYVVMGRAFSDAMLAMAGKQPCQTTTAFDVQIAEIRHGDTVLDYVKAITPIAAMTLPYLFYKQGEESQSMSAGRDIYFQSTRADSHWTSRSAIQEYTIDSGMASSNDQEGFGGEEPVDSHEVTTSTSTETTTNPVAAPE